MSLIQTKESFRHPGLSVRKYKKKVFFDNLWNEDLEALTEARGHVVNSKGEVVVNPFTKIFNYGENGTNIDGEEVCLVVEKINGFMSCATWVPEVNDVVVSTTGSLDSDFVDMARDMMPYAIEYIRNKKTEYTYVFEIVHPNDPHIIPENIGVYLLGARHIKDKRPYYTDYNNEQDLDHLAQMLRVGRPDYYLTSFNTVLKDAKKCKHEGFVVYGEDSHTVLKIKSPYYKTQKLLARKKDILTLDKRNIDEEYYPLIDHIQNNVPNFNLLSEQDRLNYMREWFYNEAK